METQWSQRHPYAFVNDVFSRRETNLSFGKAKRGEQRQSRDEYVNAPVKPNIQRTISVDVRYTLFIIDKYAGATHLIDEMNIIKERHEEEKIEGQQSNMPEPVVSPTMN